MSYETYRVADLIDEIAMGPFGSNIKVSCFVDSGVPVLNGSNLEGFSLSEKAFRYVTEEKADSLNKANAHRGDIVITHRGTLGQIVFIPQDSRYDRYVISQSQFRVRCNDKVLPEYLVYYFHTPIGQYKLLSNASQVGVPALARPSSTFQQIEVTLPELSIQKRVVEIITTIQRKIENNQELNDNLQKQLYEIYKAWYQDFLCVDDLTLIESPYGKIPQGWHYSMLGDLCKSVSVTHNFNTDRLIFLNTGDIEDGQFLHSEYMAVADMPGQAKKTIMPNDILYSEIRPINRHFAYVDFQADNYVVSTKLMVIRANSFDSRRLYHFLTLQDTLEELQMQAESRSGTFPQIRFENISKLPILIADSNTETAFITLLHAAYNQIEHNNSENKKLSELRNSLLPQLMSGKIDVSRIRL